MNNFPAIVEPQVAVLRADGNTGHILTTDGTLYLNDNKQVYMIFETLEKAKDYIGEMQFIDNETEYSIFDAKQELVEFIRAAKWQI